ncbi:YraN family protein [Zavarzinia compransoris]|uniref:UPF0102 protein DKG75_08270 n=1 Tax=Zavarzinia compransoris TaxID=1264899 RepID=A0A317E6Q5_9PROT|nr:YraN family protein [Zavarzinia compransoris]PWR21964.1 YraN family protein [Zavarzinia compransoris]TDP47298.1 putative endonuclease [Zavarzinia compransoris]
MSARRQARARGRLAEAAAALLLRLKGYRILERNWRSPAGEIDIVARRRHTLAFIEVKHRTAMAEAGEAIAGRQRLRIARAAQLYVAGRPALASLDARFDAILVVPWRPPLHIRDAWRIG